MIPFESLGRYESKEARLLYYMSLVKLPGSGGYYYRTLFEVDVGNKKLLVVEKIPPELGYVLYPSWTEYHIGEKGVLQVKEKQGNTKSVELYIPEPKEQERLELGKLIDASLVDYSFVSKTGRKSFAAEILRQNVIKIGNFLFPCSLIASTFFFTSSRIVGHIISGSIESAYESIREIGDYIEIELKPGYANVDALLLAFLYKSEFAKYSLQKFKGFDPSGNINIITTLPLNGTFNFTLRYERLADYLYVHEIENFSPNPLEGLKVKVIRKRHTKEREIKEKKTIAIPQAIVDESVETYIPEMPAGKLYKSAGIRIEIQQRENPNIDLDIEYIEVKDSKFRHVFFKSEDTPMVATINQEKSSRSDAIDIQAYRTKAKIRDDKSKKDFDINDFIRLMDFLRENFNINVYVSEQELVPLGKRRKVSCSKLTHYDYMGNCKFRRRFIYAYFSYYGKNVLLVEIDRKGLTVGPSTLILVGDIKNYRSLAIRLLLKYMSGMSVDDIEFYFNKHKLSFYLKRHTVRFSSKAMLSWCKRLLTIIKDEGIRNASKK